MKNSWLKEEGYHRQYVDVLALHGRNGDLRIMAVYWPDGRVFPVEKTIPGPYTQSPYTGAPGKKYSVMIHGIQRDVYLQKDVFFVDVPGIGGVSNEWNFTKEEWDDIERTLKSMKK